VISHRGCIESRRIWLRIRVRWAVRCSAFIETHDSLATNPPYKTHLGIHFFHEKAKAAASVPGFYLHIAPEECFAAAGIWHPDAQSLAKIRGAIASGSPEWKSIKRSKLPIEGGSLKRPPRGFAANHPMVEDLKRTDFVTSVRLSEKEVASKNFIADFAASCRKMTPLVRFVARSLKLPW